MDEPKKYYYADDDQQIGPLTMTELKLSNITRATLVWFEGMDQWLPAEQVEEVAPAIKRTGPPPIPSRSAPPPIPGTPSKHSTKSRPASRPPKQNQDDEEDPGEEPVRRESTKRRSQSDRRADVTVYKSDAYRTTKAVMLFLVLMFAGLGGILVAFGAKDEKGLGVGIVFVGLVFLAIYLLVSRAAKETYRIGVDGARGTLWVERPSLNKRFTEDWGELVQGFQMVENRSSKLVRSGGMTARAVKKTWELQVSLRGREQWWPVPGSTFYTKSDAQSVMDAVKAWF